MRYWSGFSRICWRLAARHQRHSSSPSACRLALVGLSQVSQWFIGGSLVVGVRTVVEADGGCHFDALVDVVAHGRVAVVVAEVGPCPVTA